LQEDYSQTSIIGWRFSTLNFWSSLLANKFQINLNLFIQTQGYYQEQMQIYQSSFQPTCSWIYVDVPL
jgi:hypothetical protein